MKKHTQVVGAALGTFVCAAVVALGQAALRQSHPLARRSMSENTAPQGAPGETPQQTANRAAQAEVRRVQIGRLDQAAAAALDAGNFTEAEADARQSVSLGVASGLGQEYLAQSLDAQGKTQEALQAYRITANEEGNFPRNMLPYALLLLKTGQWAQAAVAYNKQLPYLTEGALMMANSNFSADVPEPQELETAIHIGLGLTGDFRGHHWKRGPGDPTLSEFHKALALAPASPLANYYYAFGLNQQGRRGEAKAAFAKAAQLGGDDVKAAVARFFE